jgi:hypothetical protein
MADRPENDELGAEPSGLGYQYFVRLSADDLHGRFNAELLKTLDFLSEPTPHRWGGKSTFPAGFGLAGRLDRMYEMQTLPALSGDQRRNSRRLSGQWGKVRSAQDNHGCSDQSPIGARKALGGPISVALRVVERERLGPG